MLISLFHHCLSSHFLSYQQFHEAVEDHRPLFSFSLHIICIFNIGAHEVREKKAKQREKKGIYTTYYMCINGWYSVSLCKQKAHVCTKHIYSSSKLSFSFVDFSTCFFLYLTFALSFHVKASNIMDVRGGKGMIRWFNKPKNREWIECYTMHGWESAFYECCVCIYRVFSQLVASLGWNFKGNEYPRTRYSLSDCVFVSFSLFLACCDDHWNGCANTHTHKLYRICISTSESMGMSSENIFNDRCRFRMLLLPPS